MTETSLNQDLERPLLQDDGVASLPSRVDANRRVHVISAPQLGDFWRSLAELPDFFALFKVLVWRPISLRYTQSFLGILWITAQPIASTLMVFFMFNIIKVNTADGSHQAVFLFTGILVWQFFARALADATASLQTHSGILTKIYLPKIMLPVAAVASAWFDALIMIVLLVLACLVVGEPLSPRLLLLPVFLTLISLVALGIGLGLAPLNALYRDIGMMLPFALQFGMFFSPVYYATKFIPDRFLLLYHLNPMVGLIEGVRWSLLPQSPAPDLGYLAINLVTIVVALFVSVFVYQSLESAVIDRI